MQGQSGAIRLGIARALVEANPEYKTILKKIITQVIYFQKIP